MKKWISWIATALVCVAALLIFALTSDFFSGKDRSGVLKVGFIYSEDESTPYTYNFIQGEYALAEKYGSKVDIISMRNVHGGEADEPIRQLVRKGCRIIFTNLDTDAMPRLAAEYPDVQFCQVSMPTISMEGQPENYHTFNGEVYQARYAAGVIAGMKIRAMIDGSMIRAQDAKVGYVAANDSAEVVSGYTAFILGIRSVAPEAVLRVRYTGSWSNYSLEKEAARELIEEGCIIIAQHTNTMAPAIACEEAFADGYRVFHVGYHQSMMDVAPSTALVSLRTNWIPYITGAVDAVMNNMKIESHVAGHVHGNDISAGFGQGWVQLLEPNKNLMAQGTEERLSRLIDSLGKGKINVFQGNYIGYPPGDNPENPSRIIDLNLGYIEHEHSSSPTFRYILRDCVIEENPEILERSN